MRINQLRILEFWDSGIGGLRIREAEVTRLRPIRQAQGYGGHQPSLSQATARQGRSEGDRDSGPLDGDPP